MTGMDGTGTAGSKADREGKNYPAVPYETGDFHDSCAIDNYQNAINVRNCELEGLADLNQVSYIYCTKNTTIFLRLWTMSERPLLSS